MDVSAPLAAPLVLLFFVGYGIVGSFQSCAVALVDYCMLSSSSHKKCCPDYSLPIFQSLSGTNTDQPPRPEFSGYSHGREQSLSMSSRRRRRGCNHSNDQSHGAWMVLHVHRSCDLRSYLNLVRVDALRTEMA